jgi:hypothetical protein
MRSFFFLLSFAVCCGVLHAAQVEADASRDLDVVGTYIVTFEEPGLVQTVVSGPNRAHKAGATGRTLDAADRSVSVLREGLATKRRLLLDAAAGVLGRDVEPLHVYELALNGVALELSRAEALELAALPGIGRVEPERLLRLQSDLSAAWLGATAVWNSPSPFGSKGEGVVVGIIDSGLNRQHPSFAGIGPADGFVHANPHGKVYGRCVASPTKCNGKVIGIYDYTDEGLLDGIDQSNHGSLVAGIAAGNAVDVMIAGKLTRISGIAPHASLIVYKTCIADSNGSCVVGDVIAALEQAIQDGVDVVNLSLGYAPSDPWICLGSVCNGQPWDSLSEVLLNVHAAGIVGVVAAANQGPMAGSIPAPGVSPWVLTVASSRHDRIPARANELAASSGRGPGPVSGYLLPDVTAPGVDIIGAGAGPGTIMGFGTSMASPQVAGAAALLRGAHPDWTVADVASVLVTTARPVIVLPDGVTPAGLFDQGGGLVDISRALNAGLSLRIDSNGYRAANPHLGGSVAAMNEPALILDDCFRTCSVTRTFTALTAGSWNVVAETAAGVSVVASPAAFSLTAGQTREVSFSVNAEARAGEWTYGAVRMQRTDATAIETRLPLAVFADPGPVPAEIVVQATSDSGFTDVALPGLAALPHATFAATGLAEVFSRTEPLPKGPSANPFLANSGGADGAFAHFITIPANSGAVTLKVETLESAAVNVQLYAGRDANSDGKTDQSETECASTSPTDLELCLVQVPNRSTDARYWFVANNREASTPGATDSVTVRWAVLGTGPSDDGALTVTGPGHVDSGAPFSIRISWKDFTLTPGAARESVLLIGTTPDRLGNIGAIPLELVRNGDVATAATGLVPGEALAVRLLPGEAEDRLYVDVPPNASALSVTLAGSGEVNVYAARVADPAEPGIAPAPARELAAASSSASGGNDTLTITAPQLLPGRWYLTPVNTGTQLAELTITPTLSYGQARAEPRTGAYYNPARSGAGGFLYRAGSAWAYIWYTYLQDGTPTWYLGANATPGPQAGTWVVPLERYTWDGAQANGTRVGEGVLTLVSQTEFQFTWNIDGQSGSESYHFIDGGGCPPGVTSDLTGSWFAPERPGYGFSVNVYQTVGTVAAYFYDDLGIARWAIGIDDDTQAGSMVMSQYQGAGPLAAYQAPVSREIGTFERTFSTQTAGNGHLDLQLDAPLTGEWNTAHALQRLTDSLSCK